MARWCFYASGQQARSECRPVVEQVLELEWFSYTLVRRQVLFVLTCAQYAKLVSFESEPVEKPGKAFGVPGVRILLVGSLPLATEWWTRV